MKKTIYTTFVLLLVAGLFATAQTIEPIAFDIPTPIDVNLDASNQAWVTSSGTGSNDGQVIKVSESGTKETIIEGLPSFFDFAANELKGTMSAQLMADGRIFVCQGEGIEALSSTILEFHWDDYLSKGSALTLDDRRSAIMIGEWAIANGFGHSNPYSFVINANGDFLISDAAANAIFKYTVSTGQMSIVAEFPPFPNPTPIGPPMVEAVPTKILAHPSGGYLVSTLTGFPFLDGAATIYHVQEDGSWQPFATGLTLVTDMDFDPNDGQLVALQFAKFGPVDTTLNFQMGSAQLIKIRPTGELDTLVSGFGPSPGLAFGADGSAYLTHLFLSQLLRTDPLSTSIFYVEKGQVKPMSVFPNPNQGTSSAEVYLNKAGEVQIRLMNGYNQLVSSRSLGILPAGHHTIPLDFSKDSVNPGAYYLTLYTPEEAFVSKIILLNP